MLAASALLSACLFPDLGGVGPGADGGVDAPFDAQLDAPGDALPGDATQDDALATDAQTGSDATAVDARSDSGAPPALVQQKSGSGHNVKTLSVSFASAVNVHHALVFLVGMWSSAGAAAPTVSDSLGHAPTLVAQTNATVSGSSYAQAWLVSDCSAGADTVQVAASGISDLDLIVVEYTGGPVVLDQVQTATPTTGPVSIATGNIATTAGNERIMAYAYDQSTGHAWTVSAGWVGVASTQNSGGETLTLVDQAGSTPGTFSAQFSATGTSNGLHAGIFSLE